MLSSQSTSSWPFGQPARRLEKSALRNHKCNVWFFKKLSLWFLARGLDKYSFSTNNIYKPNSYDLFLRKSPRNPLSFAVKKTDQLSEWAKYILVRAEQCICDAWLSCGSRREFRAQFAPLEKPLRLKVMEACPSLARGRGRLSVAWLTPGISDCEHGEWRLEAIWMALSPAQRPSSVWFHERDIRTRRHGRPETRGGQQQPPEPVRQPTNGQAARTPPSASRKCVHLQH
jgi:hypothetical protein